MHARREVIMAIVGCCGVCASRKAAGQVPRTYQALRYQGFIACGSEPGYGGEFKPDPSLISNKSGVASIDAGFQGERNVLDYCFRFTGSDGVRDFGRPSFSFYDDMNSPLGAKAVRGGPAGCHIYFGLGLISAVMRDNPSEWEGIISGFLAHEWAHAFQYRSALDERLFLWETHADYLAGWYLGVKKARGGQFDPRPFFQALFSKGVTPSTANSYGLPQQRSDAAEAGMSFALSNTRQDRRPDVSLAAEAGYDFISAMRNKGQRH